MLLNCYLIHIDILPRKFLYLVCLCRPMCCPMGLLMACPCDSFCIVILIFITINPIIILRQTNFFSHLIFIQSKVQPQHDAQLYLFIKALLIKRLCNFTDFLFFSVCFLVSSIVFMISNTNYQHLHLCLGSSQAIILIFIYIYIYIYIIYF